MSKAVDYQKEKKLVIEKKEGHMRLVLYSSLEPGDFERGQSAGNEWEDAIERSKKLWGFEQYKTLKSSKAGVREYVVTKPQH